MTETTTTHSHHDPHSGEGFFNSDLYKTRIRPILYLAVAILLPVTTKIFHAGMAVALSGSLCILITMISKSLKVQFGILLSMVALLVMFMLNIWHWADRYFISILNGEIVAEEFLFRTGLIEGLVVLVVVRLYRRLLKSLKMRITHEWFVKKSQLKFLKVLSLFQVFMVVFWIAGFLVHLYESGSRYDTHEATLFASVFALVFAGIPIFFYAMKTWNSSGSQSQHHHHHRHRHHGDEEE
jgi:hypothetical protein